jgi:hypothetical protein
MTTVTSFNLHPSLGAVRVEVHPNFNVNIRAEGHDITIFFKSIEDLSAFADELSQRVLNVMDERRRFIRATEQSKH